jgi:hypothetical protein
LSPVIQAERLIGSAMLATLVEWATLVEDTVLALACGQDPPMTLDPVIRITAIEGGLG